MADIRWGPWSGACRRSARGHRLPPSTHSSWSLDDDLGQLQKAMLSMLADPALSDVCLVVEGVDVAAHKAVLAAWSRPFRAMFTLPMLESQHNCRVVIEDAEHKHVMVALDYLYSGRIGLNDENVMPVSALANRYEVMPLMDHCEGYMKWRLNPSNVCRHLLAAEDHQCTSMAAFALDYLAVHFDEVHHDNSSDFNALAGDTVLRVLQHDGLTVDEETVFLAVDGWAKSWRHRRVLRGMNPNIAAGSSSKNSSSSNSASRIPHPAGAAQQTQPPANETTRYPSSSHADSTLTSLAGVPPSTKLRGQETRRQREDTVGYSCAGSGSGGNTELRASPEGGLSHGGVRQPATDATMERSSLGGCNTGSRSGGSSGRSDSRSGSGGKTNGSSGNSGGGNRSSRSRSSHGGGSENGCRLPKDTSEATAGGDVEAPRDGTELAAAAAAAAATAITTTAAATATPGTPVRNKRAGNDESSSLRQQQQQQQPFTATKSPTASSSHTHGRAAAAATKSLDNNTAAAGTLNPTPSPSTPTTKTTPFVGLAGTGADELERGAGVRAARRRLRERGRASSEGVAAVFPSAAAARVHSDGQGVVVHRTVPEAGAMQHNTTAHNMTVAQDNNTMTVAQHYNTMAAAGVASAGVMGADTSSGVGETSSRSRSRSRQGGVSGGAGVGSVGIDRRAVSSGSTVGDIGAGGVEMGMGNTGGGGVGVGGGGGRGGRHASWSLPLPSSTTVYTQTAWPARPISGDGVRKGSVGGVDSGAAVVDTKKGEDIQLDKLPEEERAFVDRLFAEVRFPLISTGFLCQVVEKSAAVSGSRVVQGLLHEAYRFQAFQAMRPDAADVDEQFPGNHRVKYRGHERVLFGEGDGCVGTVDDYSSSLSEVHLVENVQRRDEKYWLPGQPEEAYFCVRLDRVRRITKFRFQNRYSEEFEVAVRRTRREEWQVIVPRQPSGGHKDVKELNLTRKRVKARHVKISLRGRKRSCYNTSLYWTELLGF